MGEQSVFSFSDYKQFLCHYVDVHKKERGSIRRMAEAAGCQRSYMSQVLGTHVHLTREQAWGLCSLFGFKDLESQYFMVLIDLARAGSKKYRENLESQRKMLKQRSEDLSERTTRKRIESEDFAMEYYSAWYWSAIHILVSIPGFQTVKSIAAKLFLDEKTVENSLKRLAVMKLVTQEKDRWCFRQESIHVPKDSPYVVFHHRNWRDRSVLSSQASDHEGIHYTMVQSVSRDVLPRVRQLFLDAIEQANRIAGPSAPQELVAINCDIFSV
ncbi:TIGR02147 family protein [Bdellovibrionota bacterium FG-1]